MMIVPRAYVLLLLSILALSARPEVADGARPRGRNASAKKRAPRRGQPRPRKGASAKKDLRARYTRVKRTKLTFNLGADKLISSRLPRKTVLKTRARILQAAKRKVRQLYGVSTQSVRVLSVRPTPRVAYSSQLAIDAVTAAGAAFFKLELRQTGGTISVH